MDLHAAMETFAEALVAENMQNYSSISANTGEPETQRQSSSEMSNSVEETPSENWISSNPKLPKRNSATKICPSLSLSAASLTPPRGIRSYPIHCVVEEENRDSNSSVPTELSTTLLCDTFAILPGSLLFSDILRAALVKIGFSVLEAIGAKGTIQVRNWKPLPFEFITDNSDCTVEEILGDVASAATLRIRLSRKPDVTVECLIVEFRIDFDKMEWTDHAVRCAVIKLLNESNQKNLAQICPLPQSMISNIANSKYSAKICAEKCQEFGEWYNEYRREHKEDLSEMRCDFEGGSPNSRMTFHPIYELPMMREWYRNSSNPSAEEFRRFLDELNNLPVRQERSKVPLRRLKIWWRNEKQRIKRIQRKEVERSLNPDSAETDAILELPKRGRGIRADGQPRKRREKKHFRRSGVETGAPRTDVPVSQSSSSCFHSNSNKTFLTELSVPAGSSSLHRPVYVNSPSNVGFHVRYVEDRPRSRNDAVVSNISSRGHLPLGLNLQQQGMGAVNPHACHAQDGLYSPLFHSCSVSNSSHASP